MHRFARLVSMYNLRQLTFPEDALDAFAGTLFELSSVFEGGFLSGLPEITFDAVLIWQPYNPLTRRVPLTNPRAAVLPSWSWVGWSDNLHSESWRSAYDYMRKNPDEYGHDGLRVWQPCSWHTTKTVNWCYSKSKGSQHILITSTMRHENIEHALTLSPHSQGWTRHYCTETSSHYYRHNCDLAQKFYYPILIPASPSTRSPVIRASFLHGHTRQAQLSIGSVFRNEA